MKSDSTLKIELAIVDCTDVLDDMVTVSALMNNHVVHVNIKSDHRIQCPTLATIEHHVFDGYTLTINDMTYSGNPSNLKHTLLKVDSTKLHYQIGGTSIGWSSPLSAVSYEGEVTRQIPFNADYKDDKYELTFS